MPMNLKKCDIHIRPDCTLIDEITGVTNIKPTNIIVEVWDEPNNKFLTTVHLHEMLECWKEHNPLMKK